MRRFALWAIYIFAYYSGIVGLFYWLNRRNYVILTYHNVIPDDLFDFSLHLGVSHSTTAFRKHLEIINRRLNVQSWPPDKDALRGCVITFDDGYKNQWLVAGPIMKKFNVHGVYFVPFSTIESGRCLAVDGILRWVSYCRPGDYDILGCRIVVSEGRRQDAFSGIYNILLSDPEKWNVVESELMDLPGSSDLGVNEKMEQLRFRPLESADLEELVAAGHQVGCHSWSHLPLASLPRGQIKRDFDQCRKERERYANTRLYSYPFGGRQEVTPDVAEECETSGFEWAFLNVSENSWLKGNPKFRIPRMSLPNTTDRFVLEAKLSGFEKALKRLLKADL